MHYSRIAAWILGAWLAGSAFMAFVATQNFRRAEEVLSAPPPEISRIIQTAGPESSRLLLRHLVGEQNRFFFNSWELAQFALGLLLCGILFLEPNNRKLAGFAAAMLGLTAFSHFIMTPELIWLGRVIEFQPVSSPQRDQFWKLHVMYGVMEAVKMLLGVVLASFLFMMRRRVRQKETADLTDLRPARRDSATLRR
jgi:hypothetical protein